MIIFEFDRCSGGLAPGPQKGRDIQGAAKQKSRDIQGTAKWKSMDIQGKLQLRKTEDTDNR